MRRNKYIGIIAYFLLIILILPSLGCSISGKRDISRSGFYFDTYINITLYDCSDEQILDSCMDICESYDAILNPSHSSSDIYRINHSSGKEVAVSEDTLYLIEEGIRYSEMTAGLFDITVGSAYELWDFTADNPVIPTDNELNKAVETISYQNIIVNKDNSSIVLKNPDTKISLGALAKGYIADKLKKYLVSQNITSAIINLGGNVMTIGCKPNGDDFNIGIREPFTADKMITGVSARDTSVVTAGVYERCFEINDKLYHHIIDPSTAMGVDTDLLSATVICDSSLKADALSTICVLKGKKDAIEMLSDFNDVSAILIDYNMELTYVN